jgi:hypothetical protein
MKIIFKGLLMAVIWKLWVATLTLCCHSRALRHPALDPRSLVADTTK